MRHPRRGAARPHSSAGSRQVPVGPSEVLRSKRTAEQTWPYRPMARGLNYDQATSIQLPCLYSISLRPIKILTFRLLGLPSCHFSGSFPVKIPHLFPNLSVELHCQLTIPLTTLIYLYTSQSPSFCNTLNAQLTSRLRGISSD